MVVRLFLDNIFPDLFGTGKRQIHFTSKGLVGQVTNLQCITILVLRVQEWEVVFFLDPKSVILLD